MRSGPLGVAMMCSLACAVFGTGAGAAPAEVPVWVVAVGANTGLHDETPLRFAEDDAAGYADTVRSVAAVDGSRVQVLRQPRPEDLDAALARLVEGVSASGPSIVHVYYSGHGDRDSLHLGAARYPIARLEAALAEVPARVRFVVLDTCRRAPEGATKGFARAEGFGVRVRAPAPLSGTVTLSAASDGEAAQESGVLRSAVFSHALRVGLRGAADADRDRRVTLDELYRYAYRQTVLRSSATTGEVMHPSVDVDLEGAGELVLGRIAPRSAAIVFPPGPKTRFVVFPRDTATIVADLWADPERPVRLPVLPGRYLVTRRGPEGGGALELDLGEEESRRAERGAFRPVSVGLLTEKGGQLRLSSREIRVGGGVGYRLGATPFGRVRFNAGGLRWRWGLGLAAGGSRYDGTQQNFQTLELEASARAQLRTGWLDVGLGVFGRSLRVEGTRRDAAGALGLPTTTTDWGFGLGPRLGLARRFTVAPGWDLGAELLAGALALREDDRITVRPEVFLELGFGFEL